MGFLHGADVDLMVIMILLRGRTERPNLHATFTQTSWTTGAPFIPDANYIVEPILRSLDRCALMRVVILASRVLFLLGWRL
jgi:hypothetical protein